MRAQVRAAALPGRRPGRKRERAYLLPSAGEAAGAPVASHGRAAAYTGSYASRSAGGSQPPGSPGTCGARAAATAGTSVGAPTWVRMARTTAGSVRVASTCTPRWRPWPRAVGAGFATWVRVAFLRRRAALIPGLKRIRFPIWESVTAKWTSNALFETSWMERRWRRGRAQPDELDATSRSTYST
jgi:hypothetical protein